MAHEKNLLNLTPFITCSAFMWSQVVRNYNSMWESCFQILSEKSVFGKNVPSLIFLMCQKTCALPIWCPYQILGRCWDVIPLRAVEVISSFHYWSQHHNLSPMPKRRTTYQPLERICWTLLTWLFLFFHNNHDFFII